MCMSLLHSKSTISRTGVGKKYIGLYTPLRLCNTSAATHCWHHIPTKTMSTKLTESNLNQRDEDEHHSHRTRMQAALSLRERRQACVPPCSGRSSLGEARSSTCQEIAGRRWTLYQLRYLCMIVDGKQKKNKFARVNTKRKTSVSHWQFLLVLDNQKYQH